MTHVMERGRGDKLGHEKISGNEFRSHRKSTHSRQFPYLAMREL